MTARPGDQVQYAEITVVDGQVTNFELPQGYNNHAMIRKGVSRVYALNALGRDEFNIYDLDKTTIFAEIPQRNITTTVIHLRNKQPCG